MCTIRVFRGLANQVAPRAGSVLRGRLKVHNSKSGTCQGGVFLVYCMMYFIILIYLIILQLSRGASGKEFFGARTHGFCTHQARPTCKNTGKVNNRSRETGTHGRYCRKVLEKTNSSETPTKTQKRGSEKNVVSRRKNGVSRKD